jgi:putative heme-binding domain-containing protein
VGGVGGKVGPDLTSIGASAPVDYLIESVQFPNRKIKEGYHSLLLETKDGLEFSGIMVRETPDQLILRDVTNKEFAVAKNNIEKRVNGGSLMPSGLVDALPAQEQLDLYRFLSELGKPGTYDASKGNVARFWRLRAATVDTLQFGDEKVVTSPLGSVDWWTSSSLVDGRLVRDEMSAAMAKLSYRNPDGVYAAARLEMPKAGPVALQIENADPSPLWVDGKPIALGDRGHVDLTAGAHVVVLKLDGRKLPDFIRVKASDGTFLTN